MIHFSTDFKQSLLEFLNTPVILKLLRTQQISQVLNLSLDVLDSLGRRATTAVKLLSLVTDELVFTELQKLLRGRQ